MNPDEVVPDVIPASSPEQVIDSEVVKTPPSVPAKPEDKTVPYERFAEVNKELAALKKAPPTVVKPVLDVEDYIDISASLEGLDQREKEYLAKQHKLTGKPIKEIRNDEDFTLWQGAYRQKVEKELTLKPSGTQPESDKPKTLSEKLATASMAEKEQILIDAGYYKPTRPRTDRVDIGGKK